MSEDPLDTLSMPVEEPPPETRTSVSGCSSWYISAATSAIGMSVVDPVTMTFCAAPDSPLHPERLAENRSARSTTEVVRG